MVDDFENALTKGGSVHPCFLNMKILFDRGNHSLLQPKLNSVGINLTELNRQDPPSWFVFSFATEKERKQDLEENERRKYGEIERR